MRKKFETTFFLKMADPILKIQFNTQFFKAKGLSCIWILSCLAICVLVTIFFKQNLISLLAYLETKSNTNLFEFHAIMLILFACVSLPILWGYSACVFTCAFIYSFSKGFVLVVLYSGVGMTFSFFVCRYWLKDWAQKYVNKIDHLKAISSIIESNENGLKVLVLTRLIPIPFGFTNAMFSITDVKFHKFFITSLFGIMPSQMIFCYMGTTVKSLTEVLVSESTVRMASLVFLFQLSIAACVMYYILNAAKKELDKHLNNQIDCI